MTEALMMKTATAMVASDFILLLSTINFSTSSMLWDIDVMSGKGELWPAMLEKPLLNWPSTCSTSINSITKSAVAICSFNR